MEQRYLYFTLLGCRPKGRNTEQHDVYIGIATSIKDLIPQFKIFWPDVFPKIHLDAWRRVEMADGYAINIVSRASAIEHAEKLFFINLGGYKPGEFEEFHYKMLVVASDKAEAIKQAKKTAFYKHNGFKGAPSHVDDKYGIDVDDVEQIEDMLLPEFKDQYAIQIKKASPPIKDDALHLGYFKLDKADSWTD